MLQLTLPPSVTAMPVPAGPVLTDVEARVAARMRAGKLTRSTGESYIGALGALGRRANLPLGMIDATLERVDELLPVDGFDPIEDRTDIAYQLMRRRVRAAVKEFVGIHAAQQALRAQRDEWNELFDRLEPRTTAKVGHSDWHPMKVAALQSFALVARAQGWQPRDLNAARARQIDDLYTGNKRQANRTCLVRLDEIREFPEVLPLLPPVPIGFDAACRQEMKTGFPAQMERTFTPWIDALTKRGWDPVSERYSDDHAMHRRVLRYALRCYLRIAMELGLLAPEATDLVPVLATEAAQTRIAREMFARQDRTKAAGRLARRTTRKYLKGIRQVSVHLGRDTTNLDLILANNPDSRKAAKDEKEMTPKNRRFCEGLVENPALERRFLFSFQELRREAEAIGEAAKAEGRAMSKHEISEVRMLGTAACFAALEIGGAPIRVEDAMALPCVGTDAQIRLQMKGSKPMQVRIPAECTKNGLPIEFPIRRNRHGCYDTIRWYVTTIRPLFPHAATSPYLFPAVRTPGAHLDEGYFGERFSDLMRRICDLPMTPHQMRHGQTSLLLNAHPQEVEVIAKRIGDTVETLRIFYGWLDSMRLVERGQDLLVGLMNG